MRTRLDNAIYALSELSEEDAARALAMSHGPGAAWRYILKCQRWRIEDYANMHGRFVYTLAERE